MICLDTLSVDNNSFYFTTNQLGMTALVMAAEGGHPAIVKMLLDAKANVNHNSNVRHSSSECAYLLIQCSI